MPSQAPLHPWLVWLLLRLKRLIGKKPVKSSNVVNLQAWINRRAELQRKYAGRRLTDEEIENLPKGESAFMICTCEIQIPGPIDIDPECPIHWDMAGKKT